MRLGHSLGLNRTVSILAVTLTGAATLLAGEDEGFALDFTDDSAVVRDTGTPANDYSGAASLGLLTYTSPSTKMVLSADGTLKFANHNFALYSQVFDNAAWTKNAGSISANAAVAPDGTTTADKYIPDATTGGHYVSRTISSVMPSGGSLAFSVYIKADSYQYAGIAMYNSAYTGEVRFNCDLVTLTSSTSTTGTAPTEISATITDVGSGWRKLVLSATFASGTGAGATIQVNPTSSNVFGPSTVGDGTNGILIWGAQLKRTPVHDAGTLADYIPTTSAARYRLPIEYDTSAAAIGLPVEEQRTNLFTYSQEFGNAAWTKTNSTCTANATTAPDGTTTADELIGDATVAAHQFNRNVSVTSGSKYTLSFYAKYKNCQYIGIDLGSGGFPGTAAERPVYFDIQNGVVDDIGTLAEDYSITSVGNGWYRITVTQTADATGNSNMGIQLYDSVANTPNFDATGLSAYVWGAQVEAGSFATSYIPTTSAQVTRAADQVSIATSAIPYADGAAGTLVGSFIPKNATASTNGYIAAVSDGSTSNRVAMFHGSGTALVGYRVTNGGAGTVAANGSQSVVSGTNKVGIAFDTNDFAAYHNGVSSLTDATVTLPTGITKLSIGVNELTGFQLSGHIRQITYLPRRATNAELQSLTA